MSRGAEQVHIAEQEDGTFQALWGPFVLRSAFQPIFRFVEGRLEIRAFEGLIRPFRDGQDVSPPVFFRSIPAGDRLHVETLTRNLHLLNAGRFLDPATMLFVNFDPSVFLDREMTMIALREMRKTLHRSGIDARRVVCEVTEQKSASEAALAAFVGALRDHGFQIAVDDYGAEDSDMERVAALKPDIVKFDAQWISRLMDTRPGVALLSVMVGDFAGRGITVVFEGLEEPWQLELAEQVGAHMVQGYVLARPELAPTSFSAFLARGGDGSMLVSPAPDPARAYGGLAKDAPRRVMQGAKPFGRRFST
ncbi:EAL domain-containing protein [Mesorhizobium sp. CAU 1741]|uniref:EAL domain-containing protein n=1 Tax=Mesorhizobium sp. CAU 1741 TaxID=3140366 RepID=UPI00325B6013